MEITINMDNNILTVNDYFELNNISASHGFEEILTTIINKYKEDRFSLYFINTPNEDSGSSFIDKQTEQCDTTMNLSSTDCYKRYISSQKYIMKKYQECLNGIESLSLY